MAKIKEAKSANSGGPQGSGGGIFAPYKPEAGRYARLAAFWSLLIIGLYGCFRLFKELIIRFEGMRAPLSEGKLPIIGEPLTWALIISLSVAIVFALSLYLFLNRPKSANLLIDTEGELRKVTWPTWPETVNASFVVVGTVIVLAGYIMLVDFILGNHEWGILHRLLFN